MGNLSSSSRVSGIAPVSPEKYFLHWQRLSLDPSVNPCRRGKRGGEENPEIATHPSNSEIKIGKADNGRKEEKKGEGKKRVEKCLKDITKAGRGEEWPVVAIGLS